MRIVGEYDCKNGKEFIEETHPELLADVKKIISDVKSSEHRLKRSKESTKRYAWLYSPVSLNNKFKEEFGKKNWKNHKIKCDYSNEYYVDGYETPDFRSPFRDMDFVKGKLGVEVQFGKYAFMVYNVSAKMTIFNNLGIIDSGIEIVPVKNFAKSMSTGVSYFEQFVWDLDQRGSADIDIPVLIFGIDKDEDDRTTAQTVPQKKSVQIASAKSLTDISQMNLEL